MSGNSENKVVMTPEDFAALIVNVFVDGQSSAGGPPTPSPESEGELMLSPEEEALTEEALAAQEEDMRVKIAQALRNPRIKSECTQGILNGLGLNTLAIVKGFMGSHYKAPSGKPDSEFLLYFYQEGVQHGVAATREENGYVMGYKNALSQVGELLKLPYGMRTLKDIQLVLEGKIAIVSRSYTEPSPEKDADTKKELDKSETCHQQKGD
jgi:hypothetical protein